MAIARAAYALGAVTGLIIRALPDRDRSHIGVASEHRLRQLWVPLSAAIRLSSTEHAAAAVRAAERARLETVAPPISSSPYVGFTPNNVWRLSDRRMVRVEIVADPFPEPPVLVVGDETLRARIASMATRRIRFVHATSARAALDAIEVEPPRRVVCDEANAFGDDGLVAHVERSHPSLVGAIEIACSTNGSEWVQHGTARRLAGGES